MKNDVISKQALLDRIWSLDGPDTISDLVYEIKSGKFDLSTESEGEMNRGIEGKKELERWLNAAIEEIEYSLNSNKDKATKQFYLENAGRFIKKAQGALSQSHEPSEKTIRTENERLYAALREIDNHISGTPEPIPYIVDTLKRTLPEYTDEPAPFFEEEE